MALQEEFEKQGIWLFHYRSFIPFLIIITGAFLFIHTEMNPGNMIVKRIPFENLYLIFCILISFMGFGIRIFTIGYTPVNTSGRNAKYQIADSLNTTGMYSIVRHPLYLGNFFMWLGPVLFTASIWFILIFCFFYLSYYERIMFSEEQFLRRKFGDEYIYWSEKVPAIIPNFKNYIKPSLPFSWKKILRKEKNGLSGIFIIFTFMDILATFVKGEKKFNIVLLGLCIVSCLIYIILKYLKWYTNILNEEGR